jgi:glycosyltransferase involved in cell wall biosynthesis
MAPTRISVIVSTYNRTDALAAVLHGLAQQAAVRDDSWEIIVADDGSRPETAEQIARLAGECNCRVVHVWHEDAGFRLSAIRNLSAQVARGDWLVFLDGDCVPFPDFVEHQRSLAEAGWFVAGNRILLDQTFSQQVCGDPAAVRRVVSQRWWRWPGLRLRGRCNVWLPTLRLPLGALRKWRARQWRVLKGCNIGVWRQDFLKVDGFDESFSGWGREDSDFAIRLIRAGVRLKDGRFSVPVLHLWHRENDRSKLAENDDRLAELLASDRTRARRGVGAHDAAQVTRAVRRTFDARSG